MVGKKLQKSIQNICCSMLVIIGISTLIIDAAYADYASCWLTTKENVNSCCLGYSKTISGSEVCQLLRPDLSLSGKNAFDGDKRMYDYCNFTRSCSTTSDPQEIYEGVPYTPPG